jgi:hypothetical protein
VFTIFFYFALGVPVWMLINFYFFSHGLRSNIAAPIAASPCNEHWYLCVLLCLHSALLSRDFYIYPTRCIFTLFISGNCFTCFGWYLHLSSGAHTTVSTAFVVTPLLLSAAIVEETDLTRQWQIAVTVWQIPDAVDTVVCAPDDGWSYQPKHVERFPDINKLCKVASCWIYIEISGK